MQQLLIIRKKCTWNFLILLLLYDLPILCQLCSLCPPYQKDLPLQISETPYYVNFAPVLYVVARCHIFLDRCAFRLYTQCARTGGGSSHQPPRVVVPRFLPSFFPVRALSMSNRDCAPPNTFFALPCSRCPAPHRLVSQHTTAGVCAPRGRLAMPGCRRSIHPTHSCAPSPFACPLLRS